LNGAKAAENGASARDFSRLLCVNVIIENTLLGVHEPAASGFVPEAAAQWSASISTGPRRTV
jgi:hypothetical protein